MIVDICLTVVIQAVVVDRLTVLSVRQLCDKAQSSLSCLNANISLAALARPQPSTITHHTDTVAYPPVNGPFLDWLSDFHYSEYK